MRYSAKEMAEININVISYPIKVLKPFTIVYDLLFSLIWFDCKFLLILFVKSDIPDLASKYTGITCTRQTKRRISVRGITNLISSRQEFLFSRMRLQGLRNFQARFNSQSAVNAFFLSSSNLVKWHVPRLVFLSFGMR